MSNTSISGVNPLSGFDSPPLLQRLCIDFICLNLEKVCYRTKCQAVEDASEDLSHDETDLDLNIALDQLHQKLEAQISSHEPKIQERLHFVAEEGQLLFHTKLSEEFFQRLSDLGQITDLVLTLFDGQKTRVRKMCMENASKLSLTGLQNITHHNLLELKVSNLVKATINDLIQCMNSWTLENLKVLDVSKSTFWKAQKGTVAVGLSKLRHLTSLNVSETEFNKTNLTMVMEDLQMLQHLDISSTKVRDISALIKGKDRLKSLSIAELSLGNAENSDAAIETLVQLEELRHLDISDSADNNDLFETPASNPRLRVSDFLTHSRALPNLTSLDISGMSMI